MEFIKKLEDKDITKYISISQKNMINGILNNRERISKIDIQELEKLGFTRNTIYCKSKNLKELLKMRSKDFFLLEIENKKYICIGLCNTNRYNANWIQLENKQK